MSTVSPTVASVIQDVVSATTITASTTMASDTEDPTSTMAAEGRPTMFDMELSFGSADYVLFVLMMLLSALIGVYYGCYKKQDSVSEYLHGGKTMAVLPIAMSLISSNISGITMLAVPAEMYNYGTQFALLGFVVFPAIILVMYLFIPMFYKLQCNSSFEYLEMRFNRATRQVASFLFALGQLLYMPVVIYVPCLALNQVSGISVHVISPIACLVCVFYTTLGGLKAVVWTDALQLGLLVLASLVVIVLGAIRVGGMDVVLDRAIEGGRVVMFNMDPSPYTRCTFWNIGGAAFFGLVLNLGTNPSTVQRFLSVPTLTAARVTAALLSIGFCLTKVFSVITGLIIFASYFYCDPLAKEVGVVRKSDQLVPYYVMDVSRDWPGLSGLFVAGVFSAALSTMSAGLNTLSGTLYTDFIEKCLPRKVSERRASLHMQIVSLVLGMFSVAMIFVVEHLGGVLQVAISFMGMTAGSAQGLFAVGMFLPWVNSTGAMAGAIFSLIFMVITVIGNSMAISSGALHYQRLPTRTDGCFANSTLLDTFPTPEPGMDPNNADVFPLFKVSFYAFHLMGMFVTCVVALAVSFATGANKLEDADPALFSPAVAHFLPRKRNRNRKGQQDVAVVAMQEYAAVPASAPQDTDTRVY